MDINGTHDPDKVVFNFSSFDLSDAAKTLLARGLDYALPEHNIQYEDYMLPYELLYRGMKNFAKSPEDEINLHARLKNVAVTSFSRFKQNNRLQNNLTDDELDKPQENYTYFASSLEHFGSTGDLFFGATDLLLSRLKLKQYDYNPLLIKVHIRMTQN